MSTVQSLTASGLSFLDRLSTAGVVSLEGMLVIFCVLALLWGVIELLHFFLNHSPENKKTAEVPTPASDAEVKTASAEEGTAEDDGAIVAAITAAITATLAEEGYRGGFRVVSFKRASAHKNTRL